MLTAVLGASLWLASQQAGAAAPPQAVYVVVPVERFLDKAVVDWSITWGGAGLDLISTDYAIHRGCHEVNPIGPRTEGRVAMKLGLAAMKIPIAYFLRRSGHDTWANILRYSGLGVDAALTINNFVCGSRNKR